MKTMTTLKTMKTLTIALSAATLIGCATTTQTESNGYGMLMETTGDRLSSELTPAIIYQIDGKRVHYGRGFHRVPPGRHVLHVWPAATGPRSGTPIPGAHAEARGIIVEPLELDVREGDRYQIAVLVRRHRTFAGDGQTSEPLGPWRTTYMPVVVRETET